MHMNNDNADQAAEWLFSHMDELDSLVEAHLADQEASSAPVDDGPAQYKLRSFVTHIGRNTGCGHYVAHVRNDGQWLKFDDARVYISTTPPKQFGYVYVYERKTGQ